MAPTSMVDVSLASDPTTLPLCGGCLERLFERAGATDLDDNVGAATAGQSAHGDVPIGRGSVIYHLVGSQSL